MTTLEMITQELDRITRKRSTDSCPCYARINVEINIGHWGIGAPKVAITVFEPAFTVALGEGASLSEAWQAFQDDFNGPDPKSLIRQADAEMGNVPDQASELQQQVAEKSHPKAGLWNLPSQTPSCWAISSDGKCYFVCSNGAVAPLTQGAVHSAARVPNTWPIPEAAKPKLRELGIPFDDVPESVSGLGADAIAIEQAEMEAASELQQQAAEKPHPKAGLWNWANQTPGCWAISPRGECYFVDSYGDLRVECLTPGDLDRVAVPNTWPIPEAAKPKLRELGVPFDDAPEPDKPKAELWNFYYDIDT